MNQRQDELKRQKRTRRLAMNRVTARERRSRKRQNLEELVIQSDNLKALNASIQQNNNELRTRIKQLSAAVAAAPFGDTPKTTSLGPIPSMPLLRRMESSSGTPRGDSFPPTSTNPLVHQLLVQDKQNPTMDTRASVLPPGTNPSLYGSTPFPSTIQQLRWAVQQGTFSKSCNSNRLLGGGPVIGDDSVFRSHQASHHGAALTGGAYQQTVPNYVHAPSLRLNPGLASGHLNDARSYSNSASNAAAEQMLQRLLQENKAHGNLLHSRRY